ncbi:MAG: DUF1217 domain-containing protein [Rhodobacteraceae bacterium]|nr:DUF1217 domain-containing protein [Paracoccaceae bacterium]
MAGGAFEPVVPVGGYAGWRFLERTMARQRAAFDAAPTSARDGDHFRARIGTIASAADLVADRRLLRVALEAFGLEADVDARAFIRKVLEDGTLSPGALANRLADKRYAEFSRAFGFGDYSVPRTRLSDFADKILAARAERRFEAAVGARDPDLRLALGGRRELGALAARGLSDTAAWLGVLGSPPLRQLFETAFGLPAAFAGQDLDAQVATLRGRARAAFGDDRLAGFAEPARMEALLRRVLVRAGAAAGTLAPGPAANALLLLRAAAPP